MDKTLTDRQVLRAMLKREGSVLEPLLKHVTASGAGPPTAATLEWPSNGSVVVLVPFAQFCRLLDNEWIVRDKEKSKWGANSFDAYVLTGEGLELAVTQEEEAGVEDDDMSDVLITMSVQGPDDLFGLRVYKVSDTEIYSQEEREYPIRWILPRGYTKWKRSLTQPTTVPKDATLFSSDRDMPQMLVEQLTAIYSRPPNAALPY